MGKLVGAIQGNVRLQRGQPPAVGYTRAGAVTRSFHPNASQCTPFRGSQWPDVTDRLTEALAEAIDTFIKYVVSGNGLVAP